MQSKHVSKEKRAAIAKEHTYKMNKEFNELIHESQDKSIIYNDYDIFSSGLINSNQEIIVEPLDMVSALLKYPKEYKDKRIALLNFASYKNPGGGFINGMNAQEECLCHESFLYNVLDSFRHSFYEWNNLHKNKGLYLNRAIYSPNILFTRTNDNYLKTDTMKFCDVITCAAPNKSIGIRYKNVTNDENHNALKSRIKLVLDIAVQNKVSVLILGAYGCGVFKQDPKEVATIFKEFLTTTHKCFDKVIFAIPGSRNLNYRIFNIILGNN